LGTRGQRKHAISARVLRLGVAMHDLAQLTDRVSALHKLGAEMASRISELEELRNRVAKAERKSYSASRKANKKAVYKAAGLAGQQRDQLQRENLA
jgi:phosphopantetheinyl transferase (holo-ACP synthase)